VSTQMVPFAKWIAGQGHRYTTAAYPMVSDPFADPPVTNTMTYLQAHGIQTIYHTGPNGYTKVTPAALTADARLVAHKNADIVVLGSVDVPTVQLFMHVFAQEHYTPKVFMASAGPDQGQAFLNVVGISNAIGMMVPNGWYGGYPNALSHVMVQDYIAKYGGTASDINADVAESYSAGQTIAAAVQATHGTVQSQLVSWLHSHTVQTVLGPVAFDDSGMNTQAANSATIFQWQPGAGGTGAQFVQVLPGPPHAGARQIIPIKAPLSG